MDGMTGNVNTSQKLNRDISLDAVKGFAIILVMIGHCIVLNGLADAYLYDAIAAVQMPLFMAVSGYLAGMRIYSPDEKPDFQKRVKVFGRRSVTYLVPFFVWMILVSFPNCLQELKTELFHLDYGLWFLATLWIITLVTMFAAYLADCAEYKMAHGGHIATKEGNGACSRDNVTMLQKERAAKVMRFFVYGIIVFVCYAGFFLQGRSSNTFLSPSLTVRYLPFYVVAYLVAYYAMPFLKGACNDKKDSAIVGNKTDMTLKKADSRNFVWNILWLISLILFIYFVYAFDMVVVTDTKTLIIQMLASFVGVYACFYGVAHFCKGVFRRMLAFVGQYTLEIYVLHFRFARMLGLSDKHLVPFRWNTILWVIATFIVMSVLTAVVISALKQIWITDLLCFGKIRPRKHKQTSQEA